MPFLTIAIPTYNRPTVLTESVRILLPQLSPDIELLIVDNCSPVPVAESLCEVLGHSAPYVTIHRNPVNIGGNANIVRCFELCVTKWLWILGDDDTPHADACATALEIVRPLSGIACLNLRTELRLGDFEEKRLDLISALVFLRQEFSNSLFISANLYCMELLRPFLSYAHAFSFSWAPHLALTIMAVKAGHCFYVSDSQVVSWGRPREGDRWSGLWLSLCLPTLCDLPLSSIERRMLASALGPSLLTTRDLCVQSLYLFFVTKDPDRSAQIFWKAYLRGRESRPGVLSAVIGIGLYCVLQLACKFPAISRSLLDFALAGRLDERLGRVAVSPFETK